MTVDAQSWVHPFVRLHPDVHRNDTHGPLAHSDVQKVQTLEGSVALLPQNPRSNQELDSCYEIKKDQPSSTFIHWPSEVAEGLLIITPLARCFPDLCLEFRRYRNRKIRWKHGASTGSLSILQPRWPWGFCLGRLILILGFLLGLVFQRRILRDRIRGTLGDIDPLNKVPL